MLIDFQESHSNVSFEADICIIGAGAAGISIACSICNSLKVIVIESGGYHPSPDMDPFLQGEIIGHNFTGLTEGRVRALGGTTRRWSGGCIRFDSIDFQKRDWVPYSGWPIEYDNISLYYRMAEEFLGLSRTIRPSAAWRNIDMNDPGFHPAYLIPKFIQLTRKRDFQKVYGRQIQRSQSITALLNATVVGLHIGQSESHVVNAQIRSLTGRSGQVYARAFVLSAGGIENARILLASNSLVPEGLGNERGLVGRFLQDHPNIFSATLVTAEARKLREQFQSFRFRGLRYTTKIALSEVAQKRQKLLNGSIHPIFLSEISDATKRLLMAAKATRPYTGLMRDIVTLVQNGSNLSREVFRYAVRGRTPYFEPSRILVQAQTEQAPDPNNRVLLSSQRDPLGVPIARIEWRVREPERRTLRTITEIADREFQHCGFGKLVVEPWLGGDFEEFAKNVFDFYHHVGTTRMSRSPNEGVVDTDCRVHSVRNLYIAGSSVFPTSGWANPTLTIIALALRLADHLVAVLRREPKQV